MSANLDSPAVFTDVYQRLEQQNVRYVVVGGVAVVLHGFARPIADLDVVIDPDPVETQRAMHAMALAGFVPSIPLPLSMVTVLRMFDHDQREVDLFARFHIPFDELWTNSVRMSVGNTLVRIPSLEDLLRDKQRMGRPRDLEDIAALTSLNANEAIND